MFRYLFLYGHKKPLKIKSFQIFFTYYISKLLSSKKDCPFKTASFNNYSLICHEFSSLMYQFQILCIPETETKLKTSDTMSEADKGSNSAM